MTAHLSPVEFVDALEGGLSPSRDAHLSACAQCQSELAEIRAAADEARATEVPEPSPLFWDHFSARVKQATRETTPRSWWLTWWRPAAALAVAAGALAIGLGIRQASDEPPASGSALTEVAVGQPLFEDDGSWSLVMDIAAEMDWSEVSQVATPVAGTADAIIEELTSEQREALARLLQKEMGDLE